MATARRRRRGTSELRVRCKMPRCTLGIRSSTPIAYVLGAIVDRGREMRGRGATERRREIDVKTAKLIAADAVPWPLPTRPPRPMRRAPKLVDSTTPRPTRETQEPAREARSPGRSAPRPSPPPRLPGSKRGGSTPRPWPRWGCPEKQMSVGAAPAATAARRASWRSGTASRSFLSVFLVCVRVWYRWQPFVIDLFES